MMILVWTFHSPICFGKLSILASRSFFHSWVVSETPWWNTLRHGGIYGQPFGSGWFRIPSRFNISLVAVCLGNQAGGIDRSGGVFLRNMFFDSKKPICFRWMMIFTGCSGEKVEILGCKYKSNQLCDDFSTWQVTFYRGVWVLPMFPSFFAVLLKLKS